MSSAQELTKCDEYVRAVSVSQNVTPVPQKRAEGTHHSGEAGTSLARRANIICRRQTSLPPGGGADDYIRGIVFVVVIDRGSRKAFHRSDRACYYDHSTCY